MTLTFYNSNQELMASAVLWYTGRSETNLGFPILPSGVTVTPSGTWVNDLNLGNGKIVKTFDGSTNYISLTDVASWDIWNGTYATICAWLRITDYTAMRPIVSQYVNLSNAWWFSQNSTGVLSIGGIASAASTFGYTCVSTPTSNVWYHVTVIKSGTTCLMYIDGISQSVTISTAFTGTTSIAAALTVGSYSTNYNYGNIKDLIMFTRALTVPEITTIMRLTNPNTGREFELLYPGVRNVE